MFPPISTRIVSFVPIRTQIEGQREEETTDVWLIKYLNLQVAENK